MKQISSVNKSLLLFIAFFTVFFLNIAGFAQINADKIKEGNLPSGYYYINSTENKVYVSRSLCG